jgi:hypothetical protein
MGWEIQTPRPCQHQGKPKLPAPAGNDHIVGDIWKCDNCGTRFVVQKGVTKHHDQRDGDYTIPVLEFRKLPNASYSTDPRDHIVDPNYRPGR